MKKQIFSTLVLSICILFPFSLHSQEQRKKVGVVLSGGGAKGMAHIKALKVIEEAGIPIDYIAGTSMGAIVGGLYAIGYTPEQLDSMVRKQNWTFLLSDRVKRSAMSLTERERSEKFVISIPFTKTPKDAASGGLMKGQNLANLFSDLTMGYHDSIDFNKLPIPFACVAADIVNGNQIIFRNGILSTAMRASMAIPGAFTPVRQDSMVLVDGGIVNNYPADVAKAMGADIIIGIDVQNALKPADKLNSVPDILGQIVDITCQANHEKNVNLTDTYIRVNVDGYSSASFTPAAIDTLMRRGEEAARAQWKSLLALKKEIGIPDDYTPKQHGPYSSLSNVRTIYVTDISFTGVEADDKKWLMKKCNLKENSNISTQQIEQALFQLRGSQSYSSASYTLTDTPEGYQLNFLLQEKYERRINLGIRFDSEEIASLLLNATADLKTHIPSRLSLTGRLGKRYAARIDYTLEPIQQRNFNFSYMFQYNDINIYEEGNRAYNTTYKYHLAEFGFSDVWYKNFRFGLGLRFEYYKYKDFLFKKPEISDLKVESEHFLSYFAQVQYNTYDKGYFPAKGSDFKAAYSLYTDNMAQYNDHAPFSALSASWASVIPITRRFAVIPSIYGRILIGRDFPYPLQNAIGGDVPGFYIPQQLPFAGVTNLELMDNTIMITSVKFRQRMGAIHYLTLTGNYGLTYSNFFDILKGKQLFGISAGYGMDSIFGPLEISLGYSNQTDKGSCFVNLGYYF
ncbi:patatin-like phospholipase family protein [Bacteroides acidifaciens]|uniref:Patatin n=2 Tax=Bacteroides acidifaciens TaxID=85831 RepID=A0A3L8ACB4_9BACE|nr:patatin-like phospholipase family protein [Bacteroides acidifaciens]MBF0728806.1 patatin-like phospholipase family protein [Bacteroides acidifaciens]MBF0834794.1 patatin-like phospholipase family protein [Bacteroides acidifaciens]MCR2004229.1 patatin-like phospholipase family protein [Bacteroides acidifaciens]NDO53189.1 patatin [Bacteroides acidifaciens]RLT81749.1 patatin [Bacteroides acidifaciens]